MTIRVDTDGNGSWDKDDDILTALPPITDETGDGKDDVNLTKALSKAEINGAIFQDAANAGSGTGGYNTFLALNDQTGGENPQDYYEQGFNSDDDNPLNSTNDEIDKQKTHTVLLGGVPIKYINGVAYYEFRVDLNESNDATDTNISIDQFKLYTSTNGAIESTLDLFNPAVTSLRYDMDAGRDISVLLSEANSSGSGNDDYSVLVPVANFASLDPATTYLYLYVEMGRADGPTATATSNWVTNGGFEEWNLQNAVILKGVKFNDIDGDGLQDPGEGGLAGVTIFIDDDLDGIVEATDGNGVQDINEQSTVTLADNPATIGVNEAGSFSFGGIPVTGSDYTIKIREVVPTGFVPTTGQTDAHGNYFAVTIGANATAGSIITVPAIGNHPLTPSVSIDKAFVNVTNVAGANSTTVLNYVGDIANYTINILNDGETGLVNVVVTDPLADGGVAIAVLKVGGFNTGDTDSDNVFDIGETWQYTATQTATQNDVDTNGGGDGHKDNSATVVAAQEGVPGTQVTDTDAAAAPIVRAPAIAITKVFGSWSGGNGNNVGDAAGDIGTYTIVVTNTGNVTLTNVVVTDPLTSNVYNVGTLAPGASSAALIENYTLTQADLDSNGTVEANSSLAGSIENTARATSNETGPAAASAVAPILYNPLMTIDKVFVNVTGGDGDALADAVGDVLNYTVAVKNTGNVTLTGVVVTDPLTGGTLATGVTLAVGATNTYNASYTLTQADLDKAGNAGPDGDIDNTATADSNETTPINDSVEVPLVYNPLMTIDKVFVNVTGGDGDALADAVGDVLNYTVAVKNTGNVTLTGVVVTDPLTGGTLATGVTLAVGATNTYNASYTLTQADLDKAGNAGPDGDIDNTATADSNETTPINDSVEVPLVYNPLIDLVKFVAVNGGSFVDANYVLGAPLPYGPQNVNINAPVDFKITVKNTGNVTLNNVLIRDIDTSASGSSNTILFQNGALTTAALAFGAELTGDDDGNILNGINPDGILQVGEEWTITYTTAFDPGQHLNTGYVTTAQGAADNDNAAYYSLINEGPGVRTPGFWQNMNNGGQFWDGIHDNEKNGGTPGFAEGELLRPVDSDGPTDGNNALDPIVVVNGKITNGGTTAGLLIGDYNNNGYQDFAPGLDNILGTQDDIALEDVLFISYDDARTLINANNKDMSNGTSKLGRDVVATWLNFFAGNDIGESTDTESPKHYLDDAVDWFQKYAGKDNDSSITDTFDVLNISAKNNMTSAGWNFKIDGEHTGGDLHNALDHYNNDGRTEDGGTKYAHDADDAAFLLALTAVQSSSGGSEDSAVLMSQQMAFI